LVQGYICNNDDHTLGNIVLKMWWLAHVHILYYHFVKVLCVLRIQQESKLNIAHVSFWLPPLVPQTNRAQS
jgi:hypothetical protein